MEPLGRVAGSLGGHQLQGSEEEDSPVVTAKSSFLCCGGACQGAPPPSPAPGGPQMSHKVPEGPWEGGHRTPLLLSFSWETAVWAHLAGEAALGSQLTKVTEGGPRVPEAKAEGEWGWEV